MKTGKIKKSGGEYKRETMHTADGEFLCQKYNNKQAKRNVRVNQAHIKKNIEVVNDSE